jgi:nicotinamidase-related amidase
MNYDEMAVILVGYQNDYFAMDGILRGAIQESVNTNGVLDNTLKLLDGLADTPALLIQTPIVFTEDYRELKDPVGILAVIKEQGAFRAGTAGCQVIPEFERFGDRIKTLPGKRGLNAFSNTELDSTLRARNVEHIVLAGAVTSVCIDSTARSAVDRGFRVSVVSDCTAGRSNIEQDFYCDTIFPLYAHVVTSDQLIAS